MSSSALTPILEHLRAEPSRTWSIIVTLYGDAVVPRGGTLWLGTLLKIFEAMGIGGNVVRTAMSRLASDGLLERSRVGRNAYYRLADRGRATFLEAAARIYALHAPSWDGAFDILVSSGVERAPVVGGHAILAPGVLIGLRTPFTRLEGTIQLRATAETEDARRLARQVWPTERLGRSYRRFVDAFEPLRAALANGADLPDLQALVARLLLVHEYRRLVLRDPALPDVLLPDDWPGRAACALCADAYPRLLPPSERWLDVHAVNERGPLPPPDPSLFRRFR